MVKVERKSNIELLRILAIIGVFCLHFNNTGDAGALMCCEYGGGNELVLRILESIFACSVDVFVLISGYFLAVSTKRNWLKPVQLLAMVILLQLSIYMARVLLGREMLSWSGIGNTFLIDNWFIVIYVALYIISPYLNIIIDKLDKKQYSRFLVIIIALFSVYPMIMDVLTQWSGEELYGVSTVGMYGSQYGYTIVQFVMMYFIGGYLAKYPVGTSSRKLLIAALLNVVLITVWGYLDRMGGHIVATHSDYPTAYEYCNSLIILQAVLSFLLFNRLKFQSKIINKLSAACFTMYLLHYMTLGRVDIYAIVHMSPLLMLLCILGLGVLTFIGCYVVYWVYSAAVGPVFRFINDHYDCGFYYDNKKTL